MDPSLDLLPTALFSPSKAAAQRAQAQEWHAVDAWLAAKYQGRSVPQFERNEDTLRALMGLSGANERKDEEREVWWGVQKEALNELKAKNGGAVGNGSEGRMVGGSGSGSGLGRGIRQDSSGSGVGGGGGGSGTTTPGSESVKDSILSNLAGAMTLEGKSNLEALANAATLLDLTSDPTASSIASALAQKTITAQALSQQLHHLSSIHSALEVELASLRSQLGELRGPAFQAPLALQRQTLDWTRNTKQLRGKLTEYQDRLAGLGGGQRGDARQLVEQEARIEALRKKVEELGKDLDGYEGLPSDKEQAVRVVKKLEVEVSKLSRKVDGMFEGLAER
jgi:HAUS augmin-like complex subunit 1